MNMFATSVNNRKIPQVTMRDCCHLHLTFVDVERNMKMLLFSHTIWAYGISCLYVSFSLDPKKHSIILLLFLSLLLCRCPCRLVLLASLTIMHIYPFIIKHFPCCWSRIQTFISYIFFLLFLCTAMYLRAFAHRSHIPACLAAHGSAHNLRFL